MDDKFIITCDRIRDDDPEGTIYYLHHDIIGCKFRIWFNGCMQFKSREAAEEYIIENFISTKRFNQKVVKDPIYDAIRRLQKV